MPSEAASKPIEAQICRTKAATDVLPLVPVIADDEFGLARIEARRGERERGPRVGDAHERRRGEIGRALADDHAGALFESLRGIGQAVALDAGNREERVAGPDLATIRAKAADLARSQRGVGPAQIEDFAETPHSLPTLSAS